MMDGNCVTRGTFFFFSPSALLCHVLFFCQSFKIPRRKLKAKSSRFEPHSYLRPALVVESRGNQDPPKASGEPSGSCGPQRRPTNFLDQKNRSIKYNIGIYLHCKFNFISNIVHLIHFLSSTPNYCQVHASNERVTVLKTRYLIRNIRICQDLIHWFGLHDSKL